VLQSDLFKTMCYCNEFENHKDCTNLEQCYHGGDDRP